MLSIPFNWAITFYLTINRLSKIGFITPFMIGISAFFNTVPSFQLWGTPAFGMYHLLGMIYLLLEGIHLMVLKFRNASFDNLIGDPLLYEHLTPGSLVCTDKKFNLTHAIWCILLGITKAAISFVQPQYFTQDLLFQVLFWVAFSMAVLVIIAEAVMITIICRNLESKFMSRSLNLEIENAPQDTSDRSVCRYLFKVAEPLSVNTVL
jgi:hypothetical protein